MKYYGQLKTFLSIPQNFRGLDENTKFFPSIIERYVNLIFRWNTEVGIYSAEAISESKFSSDDTREQSHPSMSED